ncbi:hypothetical protein [Microbacterium sp. NPDC076911]|uniref:hypothetical protein n=1 Tax=Microbacterium sp. NPDC076911 TaxID=3154958 RepID=UPI00343D56AC
MIFNTRNRAATLLLSGALAGMLALTSCSAANDDAAPADAEGARDTILKALVQDNLVEIERDKAMSSLLDNF